MYKAHIDMCMRRVPINCTIDFNTLNRFDNAIGYIPRSRVIELLMEHYISSPEQYNKILNKDYEPPQEEVQKPQVIRFQGDGL